MFQVFSSRIFSIGGKGEAAGGSVVIVACRNCAAGRFKKPKTSAIGQWGMNLLHFCASHFRVKNSSSFHLFFVERFHTSANQKKLGRFNFMSQSKSILSSFLFGTGLYCTCVLHVCTITRHFFTVLLVPKLSFLILVRLYVWYDGFFADVKYPKVHTVTTSQKFF